MTTIVERFLNEIEEDDVVKKASNEYTSLMRQSDVVAEKILTTLLGENADSKEFTLDEMMLGLARSVLHLSHLYFENEEQHQDAEQLIRGGISERVTESIVATQPCLQCESCETGDECENPSTPDIPFGAIPILACTLIEQAQWNACLHDEIK